MHSKINAMRIVKEATVDRKVNVVEDPDGRKTVFIHDIRFKGKRAVNWDEVINPRFIASPVLCSKESVR